MCVILNIYWPMRVTHEEIRKRASIQLTCEIIRKNRCSEITNKLQPTHRTNMDISRREKEEGETSRNMALNS